MRVVLRYKLRRVDCPRCGVRIELVPWAEPDSWFTRDFEEHTAYLAQTTDKTTVVNTMRVAWRTVGEIARRVLNRVQRGDPLDGLKRIGIDELSYRRHHEYITVVIDHIAKRVVWARPGKDAATLGEFFKELGPERSKQLEAVTIDMSGAYIKAVTEASPQATMIFDRFHVQRLAQEAVDEVRRAEVRESRGTEEGKVLKHLRFLLLKNPWNPLCQRQLRQLPLEICVARAEDGPDPCPSLPISDSSTPPSPPQRRALLVAPVASPSKRSQPLWAP